MQKIYTLTGVLVILMALSGCGASAARSNNRGNAEFDKGHYPEALSYYRDAEQENPDLAAPYYNSGNSYHRQENYDSAIMQYKQSNRTAEGDLAEHSNYNLGNTFFKAQDWEKAIDAYKQALRLNPEDQEAKYNLELALKQQQQQQQQQQAGGGGQPPPPQQNNQGGGEGPPEQQGQGGQQQQPGEGQQQQDDQGQSGGGQNPQQNPNGGRGLTPQEAEQLLDALGQDSQTLQERLQEGFFAPGLPPSKDW